MKTLMWIILIAGLGFGGMKFYEFWQSLKAKQKNDGAPAAYQAPTPPSATAAPTNQSAALPGLTPSLEPILAASYKRGVVGLRDFIATYGRTVQDPRLASIELDYVVLVAKNNVAEARKVFDRVKARTIPGSPVYERVKQLENTYGQ
ncbi:MAG: hypothetical protein H7X89_13230 [Rhizobiales bacterium]|nr:hypothetical protein [Hyphomicrobiales bacterium]